MNDLKGKKLLDVGTGGGRVIEESRQVGLDIIGVDIIPAISDQRAEKARTDLEAVAKKYPGSIIGADATESLPFRDNSVDIVFSHLALPEYARSPKELAVSLLEMFRVARERVIITGDDFQDKYYEGFTPFGTGTTQFEIAYESFLDFLVKNYGIKYRVIPATLSRVIPAFDFDVTAKQLNKLKAENSTIIKEAERLKR